MLYPFSMLQKGDLTLHSPSEVDVKLLWGLYGTHLERLPFTWPRTLVTFQDWLEQDNPGGYPRRYLIFDETKDPRQVAGLITTDLVDKDTTSKYPLAHLGDVNISYVTTESYAGHGVASIALTQVTDEILDRGHHPILRIASFNKASNRVAQKCGYKLYDSDIIIQYSFDEEPTLLNLYRYHSDINDI